MQRIVLLKRLYHALRGYKTKLLISSKVQCIDTIISVNTLQMCNKHNVHNVCPVKLNSEICKN